jgi:hypothetical protein
MRHDKANPDARPGQSQYALISKAEAGRVLDMSQRSVRRLVQRGVLQEVELGPGMRPRLRLADVVALAERQPDASQ